MKVCTDACLFGAWVADRIRVSSHSPAHILDIGTGTGLLSLMLAQVSDAHIDAIEIDAGAAADARENFQSSPWHERLHLVEAAVETFKSDHTYDLIISNPPFYEQDLRSPDHAVNAARHDSTLTLDVLADCIDRLLAPAGLIAILLPYTREAAWLDIMQQHSFSPVNITRVRQTPRHGYFRSMFILQRGDVEVETNEIIIRQELNQYSPEFSRLLDPYYL